MPKRYRDNDNIESNYEEQSKKRSRVSSHDRLSKLSDELILRVLSYLPAAQLATCQRVSRKLKRLAGDGQLWKEHYYNRFVRPRASRIPGLKNADSFKTRLQFSSKVSAWLDDEHLVKAGANTEWKQEYKKRHNWSKGHCNVTEIPIAQQAPIPPILVQMHDGVVYTADPTDGLRAWSAKGNRGLVASIAFASKRDSTSQFISPPTSLAIDSRDSQGHSVVLVGFEDGAFSLFSLNHATSRFTRCYTHETSSLGVLTVVAVNWPYAMTMTATQHISLYRFPDGMSTAVEEEGLSPPRLLHSLKSDTVWPPLSSSLRVSTSYVLICVAYAIPSYLSGWTVGVQEVKLALDGELHSSRAASAIDQHYRPLAFSDNPMPHLPRFTTGPQGVSSIAELRHIHAKPTSLSYTHPYLLVSHPDNTLTLYLVTSNADTLSISPGSRLWGHTSSVSGAYVGGRGKAISVSRRGDELRIWELEGGFTSSTALKRLATGDLSVQIRPESSRQAIATGERQSGLDLIQGDDPSAIDGNTLGDSGSDLDVTSELTLTRGWIGFDDEKVVFLKEENRGRQALVVYDFT